jgi:hypothetical protein
MLVHVFDTLSAEEEETTFFSDFLRAATKAAQIESVRLDREYLVISGVKKKTDEKFSVEWPSGMLYQKLRKGPSKRTLPVIWRMCRYYYNGANDVASNTVRSYLEKELGLALEDAPFCLEPTGVLSTTTQKSKTIFEELGLNQVEITVDKQSANVILLPHRGVARTLLLLLKDFL